MRVWLLWLCLVAGMSAYALAEEEPVMTCAQPEISGRTKRIAYRFDRDVKLGRLNERTNQALNAIIRLAAYKLNRVGKTAEAKQLIKEWEGQWQWVLVSRGITDHRPMSQWLADKTAMLELILGKDVMHALRLDDLITINYALPVVIRCIDNVDEFEFFLHFVHDDGHGYRGLGPVVIYWTSFFSCVGFTWGTGFLFCAPISMGAEWLGKTIVCPKLNAPLHKLVCRGEHAGMAD